MNGGEIVAALAKSHREIERSDVEPEREETVRAGRGRVDEPGPEHRRHHSNHPGDGALPGFADVEKTLEECRITRQECVQIAAVGKRAPLLEEERRDEGKQAHGFAVVTARTISFSGKNTGS